jgi:hypothetical protein
MSDADRAKMSDAAAIQPSTLPCVHCDTDLHPGIMHLCPGVKDADRVLPHQQQVNEWQKSGLKRALADLKGE